MHLKKSETYILLLFALFAVSVKWLSAFYFFPETLDTKILHESVGDANLYYPLIKYLADFNLNYSFDPEINNLKIIPLPFWGIFFHSILFKIFGFSSFVLLDFICIFVVLVIFNKIYSFLFSNNFSIILSIFTFLIPYFISNTALMNFQYLWIFGETFYNLRVPRPMITNIYFFCFILLALKLNFEKFYDYKKFFLLGAILGFSLSSFYYHFFTEIVFLLFFFIYRFKSNFFSEIKKNFKYYFVLFIAFSIISFPFFLNLQLHESDSTNRQCIFELDGKIKKDVLSYFFYKYTSLKGLIFILILSALTIIVNFLKFKDRVFLNIFYLFFLASLFGPIIFFLISNKSCVIYHFVNFTILNAFLFLIIFSIIMFKNFFKLKVNNFFLGTLVIIFISFFSFQEITKNIRNNFEKQVEYKKEFNLVTKKIKSTNNLDEISLLTFETDLAIWAIMNDVKHLGLIKSIFTPKKDYMIEEDIISAFRIIGLNDKNFTLFIENRQRGWRYINPHITKFVYYKYQANSLITFKNSLDFKDTELDHIKKTHLLLHQQQMIPRFELKRLKDDFKNFNKNLIYPELIVLNKTDDFLNKNQLKIEKYCSVYSGKIFEMYSRVDLGLCLN